MIGTERMAEALATPMPSKIRAQHRDRLAVVYVRQSSPQQVLEHRESAALQYALRRRAMDWEWPSERVLVIDEDQGCSGTSAEGRMGFQRLLAGVSLDHVGLVPGIEMSRLARSCKDCRMMVQYERPAVGGGVNLNRPRYVCARQAIEYGRPLCQSVTGGVLDRLVTRQVLAVLEPATLELSLSAAEDIQQQRVTLDRHWQQGLERARYEADRARRQYHAVEPENRLVARELERQWEQKLLEQRQREDEYDRFRHDRPAALSEEDRRLIRTLSEDIPKLWHTPETSSADRQTIVRHLIQRVVVTVSPDSPHTELDIHWAGGFASHHALMRPVARYDQLDNHAQLLARILELHQQKRTSARIAEQLNREGFRPPKRRETYNAQMVRTLLSRQVRADRCARAVETHALAADEWWFTDLARHLNLPQPTLYSWLRRGWVHARQLPVAGGRWILWADPEELDRLRKLRSCPRRWYNQPQAAALTKPKRRPESS